jgi:hypothetical protein
MVVLLMVSAGLWVRIIRVNPSKYS